MNWMLILPVALGVAVGLGLLLRLRRIPATPRPTLEQLKGVVADLARPFAIISTSGAAAYATGVIAHKVTDFDGAAIFIGAVYTGLAGLYGFRAWENQKVQGHTAEVEKAKVAAAPPPGTAQITAAPDVDIAVREAPPAEDPTMYGGPRA